MDTHTFLWYCIGDNRLSDTARKMMEDVAVQPLLSVASLWEIAIKVSLGKLCLHESYETLIPEQMRQNGIELLPLEIRHFFPLLHMPFHHRDPFDRLLLSQAISEQISFLSADKTFDLYPVNRLW